MTRALALLLALLLLPSPAPAAGPTRVTAAAFGVVADGRTDNSAALQRIVNGLPSGGTVDLPPGVILCRWPVYLDRPSLHLRGAGKGVTILKPQYGQVPPLVLGFRQLEFAGQTVTDAHRPDAFGLLDGTVAPARGAFRGYSTHGDTFVEAVAGPPQHGVISPTNGHRYFDGWGAVPGWTLEIALRFRPGPLPANASIAGLGDPQNPGPWFLCTDAEGRLTVCFRTAESGGVTGSKPVRMFRAKYPADGALHRVRAWVDFNPPPSAPGPRVGVAIDGADVPLEACSGTDGPFPGFARNLGQYPFYVGQSGGPTSGRTSAGAVPDLDVLALRVSSVARTTEPPDDRRRYLPEWTDPTAVFWLDGQGPTARHIQFGCGISTSIPVTVGFICPTLGTWGGVTRTSVSDLTVDGGGVLVGMVLDTTVKDCELVNGFAGLASLPLGMNYPVKLDDVRLTGWHCGLSLSHAFLWARNLTVDGWGTAAVVLTGCNAQIDNLFSGHCSPEAETCVLVLGDESGGRTVLNNLEVDNEDFVLPSAVKAYLAPYGPSTYVSVRSAGVDQLGPGRPVVDLVGVSRWPGVLDASGLVAPAGTAPALLGPGWTVTVDGLPYAPSRPVDPSALRPAR